MAEQGRKSGTLRASITTSSDMVYDLFCEVCADFDRHLEATGFCVDCLEYLCGNCVSAHGINRLSRSHVIQTKSEMPHQKPPAPLSKSTNLFCTEKCEKHPTRNVEYYCRDDRSLVCTVCLVEHRQCKGVNHLSEISDHLLDSQDYQQFTASLTTLKTKSQDVIKNAKENTITAEKRCIDADTGLQEQRGKVNQALDKLGYAINQKTETIKSTDVKKMETISDKAKQVFSEVESISTELETLLSDKQLGKIFVRMIQLEDRVQALHTLLDKADADNTVTAYTFEPGALLEEIKGNSDFIGEVSVHAVADLEAAPQERTFSPVHKKLPENRTAARAIPSARPIVMPSSDAKAVQVGDIKVRAKSDKAKCDINGSVMLSGRKMILVDNQNKAIKLLNLQTSTVTSELETSSGPWGVASITESQVAVTIRDASKITFVMVSTDLELDREMHVRGRCTAIIHNDGKLIVAFYEPVKIEIMNLYGSVEKKIECSNVFDWPSHMALNPCHDAIYVTDSEGNCVKRISLGGIVEAVYKGSDLQCARGVIVDKQGRVLVCGEWSNNIHLLTKDLRKLKVLVEGVYGPCSLSLCNNTDRLHVGRLDNYMCVYQLS